MGLAGRAFLPQAWKTVAGGKDPAGAPTYHYGVFASCVCVFCLLFFCKPSL